MLLVLLKRLLLMLTIRSSARKTRHDCESGLAVYWMTIAAAADP